MIIVKVGGGNTINKKQVAEDIKALKEQVIFVHGGRKQTDVVAKRLGQPTKRVVSPSGMTSVLTDKKALEIMIMVYGLLNKQWVEAFESVGVSAVGLSGADGRIWQGERKKYLIEMQDGKEKLIKDTYTGKVSKVNAELLKSILKENYLPVITQPAITEKGELINTDNDRNIAVMAGALKAKVLVVLFEAPGLLKNHQDESSLIRKVSKNELPKMMKLAKGTMKKKVMGAIEAFENGVEKIYWGDARIKNPIESALSGKGTVIK